MTKQWFIWFMIRLSGFFLLVKWCSAVIGIPFVLAAILMCLPANDPTSFFAIFIFALTLAENLLKGMVILYLLFGGRFIFRLIDRASSGCSEDVLQKDEYIVIAIRFVGVWWLYKIAKVILVQANAFIGRWILKSYVDPSLMTEGRIDKFEEAFGMLDKVANTMMLEGLFDLMIFALLAWYFLKKGDLIVRWLGKLLMRSDKERAHGKEEGCRGKGHLTP